MECWILLTIVVCYFVPSASAGTLYFSVQNNAPEQVHIAYGDHPSEMMITWNTKEAVSQPVAEFGSQQQTLDRSVAARTELFVDGGDARLSQYIHRALLQNLTPGQRYWYKVGSSNGSSSQVFDFIAMRNGTNWSPRFAVYGDLGLVNPQSFPRLLNDVNHSIYDAILHVGDFAYDMSTDNGQVGDKYMRMMEPIMSRVPYMTCPGNHEHSYNFSNYKARFSMPGFAKSMFYSFNMGPIHFVSISTEFYFYIYYGIYQIKTQYQWLENDLKIANQPENRAKRPWIILYGHRPMYCSNNDSDCGFDAQLLRDGIPVFNWYALEPLLQQYGVDLAIWAHEHSYERMWPVLQNVVRNGTTPGKPYVNPGATVHVVTGSAGCQERHDPFGPPQHFTAFRSRDYGYSRLQVFNSTHLLWEQISDDQAGKIIDKMMLVRNKHTPFV